MPAIKVSKTNGQSYLNIQPDELSGDLHAGLLKIFEVQKVLRQMQADYAVAFGRECPEYAGLPLGYKYGQLSVALDAQPRAAVRSTPAPKQSLAAWRAAQERGGRTQ